ncbi:uncharacterized protein LOC143208445 [Lasioglossum baleicum]|uniref:uncharacterized protein LOC143208445 n=1 Tax=Lasioglossum baleicum TaxID=434251 RepID=UPI003FCD7154
MAGIFNLFGTTSDLNKGQVAKPLSRANTSLGVGGTPLKSSNQLKPKGLSFRSNSDLNVSSIPHSNQDLCNKQQEYLKPTLTQLDSNGRSLSPRKEFLKRQNAQFDKLNTLSPKKTFNQNVQIREPSDEFVFKVPLTPKNIVRDSYPTPEKLASYYDMQFEFDDFYTKTLKNEFKELLMKNKDEVLPYADEGFESDPELLDLPELPMLRMPSTSDGEECESNLTFDLPELSDDDTF